MLTIDSVSTRSVQSDVNNTSWSHTCSGSNRLLVVFFATNNVNITSCTYAGVAGTFVDSVASTRKISIYRWIAPNTGANNVSITLNNVGYIKAYAISFNGANQTNPLLAPVKTTGSGTAASITGIPTGMGHIVCDMILSNGDGSALSYTPEASQTERLDSNSLSYLAAAGSTKTGQSFPTSMSWTVSRSFTWAQIGVSVVPQVQSGGNFIPFL